MRCGFVVMAILAGLFHTGFGQPRPMMQEQHEQFLFYEAVNLPGSDSTKSRVDVHYRIDQQFFVPVRNSDHATAANFKRRGEVLVELLDPNGESKAREINRFDMDADDSENALTDPRQWYQSATSFVVGPGRYTIVFEVTDLESDRRFFDRKKTVEAMRFKQDQLATSTPMFIEWTDVSEPIASVTPVNYAGNVPFGKPCALFVQVSSLSSEPVSAYCTISPTPPKGETPKIVAADTLKMTMTLENVNLEVSKSDASFTYRLTPDQKAGLGIIIPLSSERFPLDNYMLTLKVSQGKSEKELKHPFRMVWPEMPFSMRDVDQALNALRYITTEDELDSLTSGSRESRRTNLENFWRAKDRTPNTAYNEVMVEYYRRVDYATKHFNTLRETDGSKSDRGRIYILHGSPTKIDRTLNPVTGFQETWYYESLNKKFIFVDQTKSGNYTLVLTQTL
ncbi:MAG: GWxTD domain-containing protein [Ignavibacteriae bacterium]|nr:GWxTD domain-containing protein [Ignavibacteriota bacterium]